MLLVNPICLYFYYKILRVFFKERIQIEERDLERFFGTGWKVYAQLTPSGLEYL